MDHQDTLQNASQGDGARPFASALGNASAGAHSAIDGLSGAARPAVEHMAAEAHALVDRLVQAAGNAEEAIGNGDRKLAHMGSDLSGKARAYVGANPVAAIGLALGAGFLISRLIRLR